MLERSTTTETLAALACAACALTTSISSAGVRSWDGGGGTTSWHNPANWNPDGVPTAADDVVIDLPGALTVVHDTGTTIIASLQCDETLSLNAGSNLELAGDSSTRNLTLAGGNLRGNGNLTVAVSATFISGVLRPGGELILAPTATAQIQGIYIERTLRNQGTATWASNVLTVGSNGVLLNEGSFNVIANSSLEARTSTPGGSFINRGTFLKQGLSDIDFISNEGPFLVNNEGTMTLSAGDVGIGSGSHTGAFVVGAGCELGLGGGQTFSGTSSITGAGDMWITAAASSITVFDGPVTITGMISIRSSGEVRFNNVVSAGLLDFDNGSTGTPFTVKCALGLDSPITLRRANVQIAAGQSSVLSGSVNNGTIGGGDMSVGASFLCTQSTLLGPGTLTVEPGGLLTLDGTAVTVACDIVNNGTTRMTLLNLTLNAASIDNYGDCTIQQNNTSATGTLSRSASPAFFENHGTLHKTGAGQFNFISGANLVPLFNSGEVLNEVGRLMLSSGGENNGTLRTLLGAETQIFATMTHTARSLIDGFGTLKIEGGTHVIGGTLSPGGAFEINAGSVTAFNAFTPLGSVVVRGSLTVYASQQWAGLSLINGTLTGPGDVTVTGPLLMQGTMSGPGNCTLTTSGTLTLSGTPSLGRNIECFGGVQWQATTVNFNGCQLTLRGFTTVSTTTTRTARGVSGVNSIVNTGNLSKSGTGTLVLSNAGAALPITNSGFIQMDGGAIDIQSGASGNGTWTVTAPATLRINSPATLRFLELPGTLFIGAAGSLTMTAPLTLEPTSKLQMTRSAASANPVITCTGTATLEGTLNATFTPEPLVTTVVTVLDAATTIDGAFATATLAPNGELAIVNDVALWTVYNPADVDRNGVVNVGDLLSVIAHWGVCPAPCPSDCAPFGGNGQVNVSDLLYVISRWL